MRRVPYFDDFVHKQYRRGVNRLPFYTDEADYNTNAKSYYDYLARFNNYLGLLSDFVNDLADKIDDIEDRLDKIEDRLDKIEDKIDGLADGLQKIINNLYDSGAITSDDPKDFEFKDDRDIATGNINVFSNKPDNDWFIRTQNGKLENDVTIGYE